MVLQLSPQELLFLYRVTLLSRESPVSIGVTTKIENILFDSMEKSWQKSLTTGFDRWVKSESNKIEGLEDELKKIKETIPRDDLTKKFVPVKQDRQKGRPKKIK